MSSLNGITVADLIFEFLSDPLAEPDQCKIHTAYRLTGRNTNEGAGEEGNQPPFVLMVGLRRHCSDSDYFGNLMFGKH